MTDPLPNYQRIAPDVKLGRDVKIFAFVNLYGCEIGDESRIGTFVEIQRGARIGERCKISSHTFICEGVIIESAVFIGHGVTFVNDRYPRAMAADGELQTAADWTCRTTVVKRGESIRSGATLLGGRNHRGRSNCRGRQRRDVRRATAYDCGRKPGTHY